MILRNPVIDDSDATTFPCSLQSPSQLSDTTRPFDNGSSTGPVHQVQLQHVELRVFEVVFSDIREPCCFDELHGQRLPQWGIQCKAESVPLG